MEESDSDAGDAGDAEDGNPYPVDGLYKSHAEKAQIMSMTEVQREVIIAEREDQKREREQDLKLMRVMASKGKEAEADGKKRKAEAADLEDGPRQGSRVKGNEKLEAYKKKREQARDERSRKSTGGRAAPSSQRDHSDQDAEGDSEVEWDERPKDAAAREDPSPELRDFEHVRVGRSNFAKVCFYPGFDDAIKGCFCRVSIGMDKQTGLPVYRMCQIKGFTEGSPYNMTAPNGKVFKTDQYALVAHGKAEKEWPFIACSDSRFTEAEFNRYKVTSEMDEVKMPTKKTLLAKLQSIHDLLDRRWTEADIKEKLRRQNKYVEMTGPAKPAPPVANKTDDRIAALNLKNRKANVTEIRQALVNERRMQARQREELIRRREQKEKDAFMAEQRALAAAKAETDGLFEESGDSRAATPAAKKQARTATTNGEKEKKGIPTFRKRAMDDDVIGAMDLSIEIDI
ncbi:plus-3-domain-containing protein [Saccharata proteae CBS 121410]|uniref:Plus-3-domain-containing protein n=1 Tax=Saccharata proteae CBS 121410 TaxID=1314787 RepID=A0A9P4M0A5_9PEZI|nr:plus-3-domain-containing protein [Saccharata proteae CBS 121410]